MTPASSTISRTEVAVYPRSVKSWIAAGPQAAPDWLAALPLVGPKLAAQWQSLAADTSRLFSEASRFIEPVTAWLLLAAAPATGGRHQDSRAWRDPRRPSATTFELPCLSGMRKLALPVIVAALAVLRGRPGDTFSVAVSDGVNNVDFSEKAGSIICVGSNATVYLDGSRSTDLENDPLQYFWSEGTNALATGVLATNRFAPGRHVIR